MPSVIEQTPFNEYTANGVTSVFPYEFELLSAADLVVRVNGAVIPPSSFTLAGVGVQEGGTVTFLAAPTNGAIVLLSREIALARDTDYQTNGDFRADVIDRDLNRLWQALQGQGAQVGGSLRLPYPEQAAELPPAAARALRLLGFDALGQPIATLPTAGDATALALDLANSVDPVKGAALIAYNPARAYAAGTVGGRLNDELTTSGFASLQAAVTAAAGKTLRVLSGSTFNLTAAVSVPSNITIILEAGSLITSAISTIHLLDCSGSSNVVIRGPGKLQMTVAGVTANLGIVNLDGSTNCVVEGVEMAGNLWAGVRMRNAVNCHAVRNYIHDSLGSVQDAAGVTLYDSCQFCSAEGNRLLNTGWHGVLVQDSTGAAVMNGNRVVNNQIDGATAYGVACYEVGAGESDTLIAGNRIQNVTGANPGGSGGSGVYVQNTGGVVVSGNRIRNVCTATANNTLAPGGIGVINIAATLTAPVLSGNTITDVGMTAGGASNPNGVLLAAIYIASSAAGVNVNGNSIRQAAGLTPATFIGIYGNAAPLLAIVGNKLNISSALATSEGIFVFANGANQAGFTISANMIDGCGASGVRVDQAGGFTAQNAAISGNMHRNGAATCISYRIASLNNSLITGNGGFATTVVAMLLTNCIGNRLANNYLFTTGANPVQFTGTNTQSYFDKSNHQLSGGGSTLFALNQGTGLILEMLAAAAPGTGTWAVGDRVEQSVPAVGSPKGWRCTVAGSPGTWVSEGNL